MRLRLEALSQNSDITKFSQILRIVLNVSQNENVIVEKLESKDLYEWFLLCPCHSKNDRRAYSVYPVRVCVCVCVCAHFVSGYYLFVIP